MAHQAWEFAAFVLIGPRRGANDIKHLQLELQWKGEVVIQ